MRLYALTVGTVRALGAPVPAFLIIADDGSAVLVDTGPAPARPGDPTAALLHVEPDEVVTAQLDRLGVSRRDVRYVVCTHLDPDHAGNHDAFPSAKFIVQRTHYEVARSGRVPRLSVARPHWDSPDLRYWLVGGDRELLSGIELIESGGHVPGHQSVLVRLPATGPVLLAADAVPLSCCLDADKRPVLPFDLDEATVRASTRKLVSLADAEGALVVFGHDADQWSRLRTAPGHYD